MSTVTLLEALTTARVELARTQAELEDRQAEVRGLELALARLGARPGGPAILSDKPPSVERLPRTGAIEQALGNSNAPMTPRALAPVVASIRGTTEKSKDIGAALAYLKKAGRVANGDHGWSLMSGRAREGVNP